MSSIGRRASPHSHSHEHSGSKFVFSPRVDARQQSSPHELHWSSGIPSQSLTHGGQSSCAVPGLKLVSSRHLVSSIGRRASPHSHSHEHLGSKFVFSPRVEARQQSSPRKLHWSSGVPSQSLSRTLGVKVRVQSRVEARQQSSPRELHWSSDVPSQSLTHGGQSSCAVPGLKFVSSHHLVSSIGRRASPHSHSHEHSKVRVQSQG